MCLHRKLRRSGRGKTYCGISEDVAPLFSLDEDVHKRRNHRDTVVERKIIVLEPTEIQGTVSVEECKVYIQSHRKGPEGVCRHEPRSRVSTGKRI